MDDSLLYLSRADVQALGITPLTAREAVLQAFADHAAGLSQSLPKAGMKIGPGHGFQAMPASSSAQGIATVKWVAMAPVPAGSPARAINALICVNDITTGAPIAVMDGDEITLIRTAATSAAAAARMAPAAPEVISFFGCGLQAYAHLDAFRDLYPGLKHVLAFSRSRSSAEKLCAAAVAAGLTAAVGTDADAILAESDIVISLVPGAPGLRPFLDARLMKKVSFAAAVDIGRSWLPESLPAFDMLATDSLEQSKAPYDVDGNPVTTASFETDLVQLAGHAGSMAAGRRSFFCFRGVGLADMALAGLIVAQARAGGRGVILPR